MIDYDSLFAMRVAFQDVHNDESEIIKELKTELRISGMPEEEISDYLVGFYSSYGINIDKELIESIDNQNNQSEDEEEESGDDLPSLENDNDTSGNIIINSSLFTFINPNLSSLPPLPNIFSNLPPGVTTNLTDNTSSSNSTPSVNTFTPSNSIFRSRLYGIPENNTINNPPTQNISNFLSQATNLINVLNSISNNIAPQNMEDVAVTLDKKDLEKIETKVLSEKLETTCSVCMCDMDKDEEVSILPCKHVFHTDCINEWLVKYNYKCPICRKECGKSNYEI